MTVGARILVADDDAGIRETLEAVLASDGFEVGTAGDGDEVVKALGAAAFEVILLDLRMPGCEGLELLEKTRELAPDAAVIMMTAYGSVKLAVEAVKQGAFDFITKPFDLDEMRLAIKKALEVRRLTRENQGLRLMLNENVICKDIVGSSPAMQDVFKIIRKVVNYDVTVLITGESGTGKELVAQAIHRNSARRDGPYIKLNCASLPETLLESELFGYDKGAFTGATASKPGRFELAEGGTLFLDEIGDTSLNMQAKLLRVLQEKEFERVGGRRTIKADVRFVTATNKDLRHEVRERRFREDLFYRLNVVPIHLPPLRERKEDIPALAQHFIKELNLLFHKEFVSLSSEAMACLLEHDWPGNIRELRNVLEKAVVLGEGSVISVEQLPDEIRRPGAVAWRKADRGPSSLADLERDRIEQVLRDTDWNQSRAAAILGIHRNTLRQKIERFGLKER
ncbi:MAG: sigma-54-dependent transcriptional regulator [Patescibacteria group bacterium]